MIIRFRHDSTFDAIFNDQSFEDLAAACAEQRQVVIFTSRVIPRLFTREEALDDQRGIRFFANAWSIGHPTADDAALTKVREAGDLIARLYSNHDPDHVRGALLEGLVLARLEDRYSGCHLEDNCWLEVEHEGTVYTPPTSLDVTGWDEVADVAECHYCKARARWIEFADIAHMDSGLPRPHFKIGVVSTNSWKIMDDEFRNAGITVSQRVRLVPLERLWDLAPLWG